MGREGILRYWLSLLLKQRWMRSNGLTVRQDLWKHIAEQLSSKLEYRHIISICSSGKPTKSLPSHPDPKITAKPAPPLCRSAKTSHPTSATRPAYNASKTINPRFALHPDHLPIETAVKASGNCYPSIARKSTMVPSSNINQHRQ